MGFKISQKISEN